MKIAPDGRGAEIDPDLLGRQADPALEARARAYAARRFPAIADAPIVGTRVCQYDLTDDTHFLVARHPEQENWWLVGGGSGTGSSTARHWRVAAATGRGAGSDPEPRRALGGGWGRPGAAQRRG